MFTGYKDSWTLDSLLTSNTSLPYGMNLELCSTAN